MQLALKIIHCLRVICGELGNLAEESQMIYISGSLQVCQDFDPGRFNFTKIPQKEILFHLDQTAATARFEHSAMMSDSPNLVLINVSPIEYGHVLLVPRVLDCLPQVLLKCKFPCIPSTTPIRSFYRILIISSCQVKTNIKALQCMMVAALQP